MWEEVETWVNSLLEEGYDLSEYTWEEMYESYLEEKEGIFNNDITRGISRAAAGVGDYAKSLTNAQNRRRPMANLPTSARQVTQYPAGVPTGVGGGNAGASVQPPPKPTPNPVTPVIDKEKPVITKQKPVITKQKPVTPTATATAAAPKPAAPKPTDGAERRTPTSAELRAAQNARKSALEAGKTKPEAEKSAVQAGIDRGTKLMGGPEGPGKIDTKSVDAAKAAFKPTPTPKPVATPTPKPVATPTPKPVATPVVKRDPNLGLNPRERMRLQSFDLFDLVKGHLLDEGYADTEEAALAIMINMSEEWRQSIIQ